MKFTKATALAFLLLALGAVPARAAWTFAATNQIPATEAAFTNAFYTAADNTVIQFTNTSYTVITLGTAINYTQTKSISIIGQTNLVSIALPNVTYPWSVSDSSTNPILIYGIDFIGAANNSGAGLQYGKNAGSATPFKAFVDFSHLSMTNCVARGISLGYGDARGVIHHCLFRNPSGAGNFNSVIVGGNEYYSWANPNPLGTTNNVVIEDCIFDNESGAVGNGHFDGYNGGQAVFRHNTFINPAATGVHGYDSQVTSFRSLEIYANIFTNMTSASVAAETRGGVMMIYSNTVYGSGMPTNSVFYLNYYRSCWGSYQETLGHQGIDRTNYFSGTATGGTATTLVCANTPLGVQYGFDVVNSEWANWQLVITGGTGNGQTRTIASDHPSSQTAPGTMTFTVSSAWTTTPDNTSTFELRPANGCTWQIGNQPVYTFVTGTPSANRQVKIGVDLSTTLDNLKACVNGEDSASGSKYYAASTINYDLSVASKTANTIVFHNILDGTGTGGYPGAFQEGVITFPNKGTNTGVVLQPCLSVKNTLNGTNVGFTLRWDASSCTGPDFNTNSVVAGRDYYETNSVPYALLAYPHATIAELEPRSGGGGGGGATYSSVSAAGSSVTFNGSAGLKVQ